MFPFPSAPRPLGRSLRFSSVSLLIALGGGGFVAAAAGCSAGGNEGTGGTSGADSGGTGTGGASGNGSGAGSGAEGGSGNSSGSGGDAAGGTSGAGGGATTGGCSATDVLCETFDSYANGAKPTHASLLTNLTCPDPGYQLSVQDGALSTSGASTSTGQCTLHYDLLSGLTDFWVTARLQITGTAPAAQHEVTFFELGPNTDNDPELRIGYRGDSSCPNGASGAYPGIELGATVGPGGEYTGCTGVVPPANQWFCLEVHVIQDADSLEAVILKDGTKLDTLVHSSPQEKVLGNFATKYLKVGMGSYTGVFDGLLIDSIAVSAAQVGCGG